MTRTRTHTHTHTHTALHGVSSKMSLQQPIPQCLSLCSVPLLLQSIDHCSPCPWSITSAGILSKPQLQHLLTCPFTVHTIVPLDLLQTSMLYPEKYTKRLPLGSNCRDNTMLQGWEIEVSRGWRYWMYFNLGRQSCME